jgi:hypothetical protein
MLPNVINSVSFLRICVEDFREKVFGVSADIFGDFKLASEYFLVEFCCLWILKRQTSTKHCIKDDSTAPNIDEDSFIFIFALNHLWGSIAR